MGLILYLMDVTIFSTTSLQVLFDLPSTSESVHFHAVTVDGKEVKMDEKVKKT